MQPTKNLPLFLMGLALTLLLTGCGSEANHAEDGDQSDHNDTMSPQVASAEQVDLTNYVAAPYPLQTCAVRGTRLGSMGDPVTIVHDGREVKFCCEACEPAFREDPDRYLAAIDAAVVEQQLEHYPMATCPISGDPLGDEPVNFVYENRLVRFCCNMCVEPFLQNPNAALEQMNQAAVEAQMADYPAASCPISGQSLGSMGRPIDMMVGHRLVRLCCDGCIDKVNENPQAALDAVYGQPATNDSEESEHAHDSGS